MELIFSRDFPIETVHVDRFGRLKPSMILYFAQEIATDHCAILGCDWDTMAGSRWMAMRWRITAQKRPFSAMVSQSQPKMAQ